MAAGYQRPKAERRGQQTSNGDLAVKVIPASIFTANLQVAQATSHVSIVEQTVSDGIREGNDELHD